MGDLGPLINAGPSGVKGAAFKPRAPFKLDWNQSLTAHEYSSAVAYALIQ
jgi:hypothetical protein